MGESTLKATVTRDVVRIDGTVEWQIQIAAGGSYVGICDPLGLTLQAETWAAMMEEIGAVQNLLFKDLCETNELDQFLQDRGWRAQGEPDVGAIFDLPFIPHLVEEHGQAAQAH